MLDLDAIETYINEATPGPWHRCAGSSGNGCICHYVITCSGIPVLQTLSEKDEGATLGCGVTEEQAHKNGLFAAKAREDMPKLIAEIKRLKAAIEKHHDEFADEAMMGETELWEAAGIDLSGPRTLLCQFVISRSFVKDRRWDILARGFDKLQSGIEEALKVTDNVSHRYLTVAIDKLRDGYSGADPSDVICNAILARTNQAAITISAYKLGDEILLEVT